MVEDIRRKTRHWQNIVFKKCPDCDLRLENHTRGYMCPDDMCGFFITREGVTKILLDDQHAAVKYLSKEAREVLNKQLEEIGIYQ